MKVKRRMNTNVITASPGTSHREAMQLMHEHNISRLPVVDDSGHVVGIVSKTDLLSTGPSRVTSLSIYEIYTLLDELTLEQIMTRPVLAVEEDCSLTAAAHYMVENDVGSLLIMRGDELVGIITSTDIFKTFVEIMGGGEPGSRIDVQVADKKGQFAAAAQAFNDAGSYIISIATFKDESGSYTIASFKERGADIEKLKQNLAELGTAKILEYQPMGENKLLRIGGPVR
jgi:acetoin utilization protein AcuB